MNYNDYENNYTNNNDSKFKKGIIIFLVIITLAFIISSIISFYKISKLEDENEQLKIEVVKSNKEFNSSIEKLKNDIEELKIENRKIRLAILKSNVNQYGIKIDDNIAEVDYNIFKENKGNDSILNILKDDGIETINFKLEYIVGNNKYKTIHTFPVDTPMSYIEEYINEALDIQLKCINEYGISINSNEITWDIAKYYKAKGNFEDSDEDVKIAKFLYTFNISNLNVQYINEDTRYNWNNTWKIENSSYENLMENINKYARENYSKVSNEIKNQE